MTADVAELPDNSRPRDEEALNALTHGLGFALAVYGSLQIHRVQPPPETGQLVAWWVYCATLISMYAASTLHHAVSEPRLKHALRVLDQGVIYLLIAGTFTPLTWAHVPGRVRWAVLTVVWIPALVGKYMKVVKRNRVHDFSSATYLLMGWLPAMIMLYYLPRPCFAWLLAGGLLYSLGTIFLMRDRQVRYFHPLWHLMVMAASACHYYTIYRFSF